jgi:hypothetical protein
LGRPLQKAPFSSNSSINLDVCLSRRLIKTVVILFLSACSFPLELVYRVVASQWTSTVAPLFRLSGITSLYKLGNVIHRPTAIWKTRDQVFMGNFVLEDSVPMLTVIRA